ncbi:hypothetical protein Lepil_0340 [Leptonema illini DSM 21528]|uniref:Uncharacterized protein n=1 Tax=Leptonema illini DSM 21528 TaxID=929563 RepID=H2CKJ2_9LEPT|nr:hypothetical protein Lepil_0340 [Leptonema illini DSM 21528]
MRREHLITDAPVNVSRKGHQACTHPNPRLALNQITKCHPRGEECGAGVIHHPPGRGCGAGSPYFLSG